MTTFVNVKIYALTLAQIVTTMIVKHGVATGDDIQRLKEPLSQALLSLSDFERHMGKYLLASQKLTRAGQARTHGLCLLSGISPDSPRFSGDDPEHEPVLCPVPYGRPEVFGYPVSVPYGTKRVDPAAIGFLSLLGGGYPSTSTSQSPQ
jgi:hypothetical protein